VGEKGKRKGDFPRNARKKKGLSIWTNPPLPATEKKGGVYHFVLIEGGGKRGEDALLGTLKARGSPSILLLDREKRKKEKKRSAGPREKGELRSIRERKKEKGERD